jgi:hypothetical protein
MEEKMKILLPVAMPWGVFLGVEAEIVDVGPQFDFATFAVHRAPGVDEWRVSNIETGRSVSGSGNKADAIKNAVGFLKKISKRELLRRMNTANDAQSDFPYLGEHYE